MANRILTPDEAARDILNIIRDNAKEYGVDETRLANLLFERFFYVDMEGKYHYEWRRFE